MAILVLTGAAFMIIWEMFHGKIFLNSVPLLLLVNIYEWVDVEIDVYISHCKYQVKSPSSPWSSATCPAVIVCRNHFFCLYQQNKTSESKESSDRLAIFAKGFLELPNLHMLIKQKSLSLPRNLTLGTFGKLLIVFSTKINLLYLIYSLAWSCCLLHLIKQIVCLKIF